MSLLDRIGRWIERHIVADYPADVSRLDALDGIGISNAAYHRARRALPQRDPSESDILALAEATGVIAPEPTPLFHEARAQVRKAIEEMRDSAAGSPERLEAFHIGARAAMDAIASRNAATLIPEIEAYLAEVNES